MTVHFLQHVPFEGPAVLEGWAKANKFDTIVTRLYSTSILPDPSGINMLIVMGGPMGVHDEEEYPWLTEEKAYIQECLNRKIKTVGICLGAQLLADILGARVYPNQQKEIGWYPIEWNERAHSHPFFSEIEKYQMVLHWHGDTFEIPKGAINLAKSTACARQGFLYRDKVLGLQFHLEMDRSSLKKLIDNSKGELSMRGDFIQSAEDMLAQDRLFEEVNSSIKNILNRFVRIDEYFL